MECMVDMGLHALDTYPHPISMHAANFMNSPILIVRRPPVAQEKVSQ